MAGALCGDQEVVLEAVQQGGRALAPTSVELRGGRGVVLASVQQSGLALQFASVTLRADWGVVFTAALPDGDALDFASEALQADPKIQMAAWGPDLDDYRWPTCAPVEILADPGVGLAAVRRDERAPAFVSKVLR